VNARAAVIAGALAIAAASACSGDEVAHDVSTASSVPTTVRPPASTSAATSSTSTVPTPSSVTDTTAGSVTVPPTETSDRSTIPEAPTSTVWVVDDLGAVVVPLDPDVAAGGLASTVGCDEFDPRIAFADLAWSPSERADAQRVQVTADPSGFDGDATMTSPELDRGLAQLRWLDLAGQAVHSWRVITRTPDDQRWYASPTATFEGPVCAIDYQSG
jgi:hypothetical protein